MSLPLLSNVPEIIYSAMLTHLQIGTESPRKIWGITAGIFLLESLILRGKLVSMPPLLRQTSLPANKNVIIKKSSDGVKK